MRIIFPVLVTCLLLSACNVNKTYSEQVLLSNGTIIYAQKDLVVRPNEFLVPGAGPIKQARVTFKLQDGDVVWPGNFPGTDGEIRKVFPITFELLNSTPVIVVQVWGHDCKKYGNPPEGMVAFAYRKDQWKRIELNTIPMTWRLNVIQNFNPKDKPGHTYTLDDKKHIVPGFEQGMTLEQATSWARQVADTCGHKVST